MPIGTSGISPQGGTSSFVPPISPPVSGSPGANKYLRSDGAGVVGWVPVPAPGIPDPGGVGYLKETAPGVFANISPIPSSDLVVGTAAGSVAAGNDTRFPPTPSGAGKLLYDTGAAYAALPAGSSVQVLHGGATPGFGPVAATDVNFLPLAVSNGGTGYNLTGRVVWVTQLSDLGPPSGGYYPQIADTYVFANSTPINLGTDKLKLTGPCHIYGNQRSITGAIEVNAGASFVLMDSLFQTCTTATAINVVACQRLFLRAGRIIATGQIGIDTTSGTYSRVHLDTQNMASCAIGIKVGGVAGNRYVLCSNGCGFTSNTIGIQVTSTAQRFGVAGSGFLATVGAVATHIKFDPGVALVENATIVQTRLSTANIGDKCIEATPTDFTITAPLQIEQNSFDGPGTYWSGFSANNKEIVASANNGTGIKNSYWRGFMGFQNGVSVTTVTTKDTYYAVAGTFVAGDEQLLNYSAGVITNNSGRTLTINARAEAGGPTSNPDTWAIAIVKNAGATFDPAAPGGATLISSAVFSASSRVSMTVGWQLTLAPLETLRPMVTNKSANGRTLTAEFCSLVLAVTG